MRPRHLTLLTPLLFSSFFVLSLHAQNGAISDDAWTAHTIMKEGVTLARKKKFDEAREKFGEAGSYWHVRHQILLFTQILDDVDEQITDKVAGNIFKAVAQDFKTGHKKAVKAYDKILKKHKAYWPLHILKGEALASADLPAEAQAAYAWAVALATDSALPYHMRGNFFSKIFEPNEAITDFSKAIEIDSTAYLSRFERGYGYCVARDYDSAILDFEILLQHTTEWTIIPIVIEAFYNRGVRRMQNKAYRDALRDFDRAIEIDPDYVNSYFNRALSYRNLKKYGEAVADYGICLEKNPDFVEAYYQRASTHFRRKHYSKAVSDLNEALAMKPHDQKFHFKLAESYYKLNKFEDAILHFDEVIKLNSNSYWAYYWRGFAYRYSGKTRAAVRSLEKFISMAPKQYKTQITSAQAEINQIMRASR